MRVRSASADGKVTRTRVTALDDLPHWRKDPGNTNKMFGMRRIYYKAGEPNAQAVLRFGNNTLVLMNSTRPGGRPYVDHFALEIENYDQGRVEAELRRRGYNPQPDSKLGWTIEDPEGMRSEPHRFCIKRR